MSFEVPADVYDRFIGRYSYGLCEALAGAAAIAPDSTVLDIGAGTGAGTRRLVELVGAERVAAVDPSEGWVEELRARCPGVDARVATGEALPFADDAFDATLAQLVLNFMADPEAGVAEMRRVTRPGGVVGASVWDYPGEMTLLRVFWEAAAALDADGAEAADERTQMRLGHTGELGQLWRRAGLDEVEEGEIVVSAEYEGFDDLWAPFTLGVGPAGRYAACLDPEGRDALEDEFRRRLAAPDGAFRLSARAWFAIGGA
ncbi:MAG: class I SAM-dependent methyltransferase [Gaiellaceae bacterium]